MPLTDLDLSAIARAAGVLSAEVAAGLVTDPFVRDAIGKLVAVAQRMPAGRRYLEDGRCGRAGP